MTEVQQPQASTTCMQVRSAKHSCGEEEPRLIESGPGFKVTMAPSFISHRMLEVRVCKTLSNISTCNFVMKV